MAQARLGRTQAAERRSMAHADGWCRMEFAHPVDIRIATRAQLQPRGHCNRSNDFSGRMSNRGQICLSMSSYGECDGPDRVLPIVIQLPATDSANKTRCSVLDVMEASTRLINPLPLDVVLVACHALQMPAAAVA